MTEKFHPIVSIAESYILEVQPNIQPEIVKELGATVEKYIHSKITFEEASAIYLSKIETTRPLERISAILSVSDTPIQAPPESSYTFNKNHNSTTRKKTHPWSEYEDQRLLAGINKFGLDNWASVSVFVGNGRTRAQCSQRWFRGLDPRISKVLWTQHEENHLLELVKRYGDRSWIRIASELGNRSDAQCRYHYRQMLKDNPENLFNSTKSNLDLNLTFPRNQFKEPQFFAFRPQIMPSASAPQTIFRNEIHTIGISSSQILNKKLPSIDSFLQQVPISLPQPPEETKIIPPFISSPFIFQPPIYFQPPFQIQFQPQITSLK